MNKQDLQKYIFDVYGVTPDFPWESNPAFAVYRHTNNRKWFALVMDIPKSRLGLREDGMIDVVNLKCDPVLIGSLRMEKGIFPAYHMSKDKWISVALDGSVDDVQIKILLDMSFERTCSLRAEREFLLHCRIHLRRRALRYHLGRNG